MRPFSSNWLAVFIASLAAIFLLPLHNSESDHRVCSRRCKNAASQIPALRAGIPTRLRGRMLYGLCRSSPRPGTTTIWQGETLVGLFLTSELGPRLLLSCYVRKQRASLFPPPCSALLNLIQRDIDPSVLPVVPGPQICPWTPRFHSSSSHPLRLSANAAPLLGWRLSKQFEFQSIAKKSTMQKKNLLYMKMLSEIIKWFSSRILFSCVRFPSACYYVGSPHPKKKKR